MTLLALSLDGLRNSLKVQTVHSDTYESEKVREQNLHKKVRNL
jgi:hypothetical protein